MLIRWNDRNDWPAFGVARPFGSLRRELDRLFYDFERGFGAPEQARTPQVTLEDKGTELLLRAELPGLSEKEVELTVTGNALTLKAERKAETPEGYSAHRRERSSFSFTQSYELPAQIDPEKAQASMKQGVLTLTLPKAAEAQPKRISVAASA